MSLAVHPNFFTVNDIKAWGDKPWNEARYIATIQ